jgi:hypothetical protein
MPVEHSFNDRLIRFPELEKIFGVCKRTVRRRAESGELRKSSSCCKRLERINWPITSLRRKEIPAPLRIEIALPIL